MWSPEDFPGADHVPWQLLIRARYQFQVDALVASMISRAAIQVAPRELGVRIAKAAMEAARFEGGREPASNEARLEMLELVADWDGELCPRPPGWPWPHFDDLDDIGDPITLVVLERAARLLQVAGSEQLNKVLGSALQGGFEQLAA